MVENGFFYAACKASESRAKENAKKSKIINKFCDIMTKYNTDVHGLQADKVTKAEYATIQKYIEINRYEGLYPNLMR